jgi:hypothetical protein
LDGANRAIYSETVGTGDFQKLNMGVSGSTPARFGVTGGRFVTTTGGTPETRIAAGGRQATINQSGAATEVSFGNYFRLGLDRNSVGIYNLSGGALRVYRNTTINDFFASVVLGSGSTPGVGQQHATGMVNITGDSFLTRTGVYTNH